MKRQYFSILGINTNFVHKLNDVCDMLEFHDDYLRNKVIPDSNKMFIVCTAKNNIIVHHYYYQQQYLFSIAAIKEDEKNDIWKISSKKIKIIDIIYTCLLSSSSFTVQEKNFINSIQKNLDYYPKKFNIFIKNEVNYDTI